MKILSLLLPCMRDFFCDYAQNCIWSLQRGKFLWKEFDRLICYIYKASIKAVVWVCPSLLELASQFSCKIPKLSSPQLHRGNSEVDRNRLFWSCTGNPKSNSYIKSAILVSYLQLPTIFPLACWRRKTLNKTQRSLNVNIHTFEFLQ